MKTKFKILTMAAILFAAGTLSAQDAGVNEENESKQERKVRPVRFGTKLGLPNLIGGNVEYVTPLLTSKLAVTVDYSTMKSDWLGLGNFQNPNYGVDNENSLSVDYSFSYMEGGLNYYFFKPGRGLYGSLTYGIIKFNGTTTYPNNVMQIIDISHNSFNVKLGAKLGGLFYFRPEVGYSFNSLPTSYNVEFVENNGERSVFEEEIDREGFPEVLFSGFIANIGLGFAF